jgi:hypothetical protein
MSDQKRLDAKQLRQAIATLETQQQALSLDLTVQIAKLRQRLEREEPPAQSGTGAIANAGGVAAGVDGVAVEAGDPDSAVLPYLAEYVCWI